MCRKAATGVMLLYLAGLAASGGGCWRSAAEGKSYPYKAVTTVAMVTDIVKNVAGDKAQVTGIIGEGVDPHLYKPTRDDMVTLMNADIIFYNGLMLEGKMADTLAKVSRDKPAFAVAEALDKEYLLAREGAAGHPDPHVWMDPSAWAQAVQAVAKALRDFDPPNAAYYQANADAYANRLMALHEYGKKVLATVPETRRVLITSHDAFNYFGRAYGLTVLGVQGISTESEAGLQDINRLVDIIVDRDVRAVFVETSVSPKNIQALIDGAKARGKEVAIGGSLFSDAMGAPGTYEGTYIGMLDHNISTVARALGGEVPAQGMQGRLRVR